MQISDLWDRNFRVLVADDHKLFRQSVCNIVSKISGIQEVGEASNGVEAMEKIKNEKWDLVLLDLNMPILDGFNTLMQLDDAAPPVIVVSMFFDEANVSRAFELGAMGYVNKDCDVNELRDAIQTVLQGEPYYPIDAQHFVISSFNKKDHKEKTHGLTAQEIEVLKMICQQKTGKQIAQKLNISEQTVNSCRITLLRKTHKQNMAGLVMYAIEYGYVIASHNE